MRPARIVVASMKYLSPTLATPPLAWPLVIIVQQKVLEKALAG